MLKVDAKGKPLAASLRGRLNKVKISFPKLSGSVATGIEKAKVSLAMSAVGLSVAGFDTEGITAKVRSDEKAQKSVSRFIQVDLLLDGVAYETLAGVQYKVAKSTGTITGRSGK